MKSLTGSYQHCLMFAYFFVSVKCRKSQDRERDLKLLLDMYKTVSKDTREKAQVFNVSLSVCIETLI